MKANQRYHDHVAARYDEIYSGPRWEIDFRISWESVKANLPSAQNEPLIDLGCGTGRYGLRLAKSGYRVVLCDLSVEMLEVARRKAEEQRVADRVTFLQADLTDLSALPSESHAFAVAEGDPISFALDSDRALREIRRILRPGACLVASVDQKLAAIDHYVVRRDLEGLRGVIENGKVKWLANRREERFPVQTFTVEELSQLLDRCGFEVRDLLGKTVLPLKELEPLLEQEDCVRRILELEKKLCRLPSALGRASHLQFTARRR